MASYRTRAASSVKAVQVCGGVDVDLILDHGFRIYSEQRICLNGVTEVEGKEPLIKSFVENWIVHACKPSTLWIETIYDDEGFGYIADISRVVLTEFGEPTEELESLAGELIAQGLCEDVREKEVDA